MGKDKQGMRALILVGGFGTRLRPLTLTVPKPLVPFCNKPMIIHQVEALKKVGVTEIILAVAYRPEAMKAEMDAWGKELGVTFVFSVEEEPLGTAGPLALARDILLQDDEPFFVLNSDVTCSFPLKELLSFHRKHGREGTIMVTKVTEWEKYGVVVYDKSTNAIERFVEKPKTFTGDHINAGIYLLNKSVLDRISMRKTSIEKEVFPKMANDKELYAFTLESFWMDIGQPRDFIEGMEKYLTSLPDTLCEARFFNENTHDTEKSQFKVIGCVIIDPTAVIGPDCVIGPNASIGANCKIGPACRIDNAAIFPDTVIGTGTMVSKSIIGWNNRIGSWCHVENISVSGDDVYMANGVVVNGIRVLPNKEISRNYFEPEIVM